MVPGKRRNMGRAKGSITLPPTSTHAVNTRGFAALADEIYLEIVSHIPSVPIPTSIHLKSYPEIRRSRHETFLSLSQTSRSLRRFFWRYLWQHIEVREGMKIGDKDDTLKVTRTRTAYLSDSADATRHKEYAIELVRQLEIVTVRNPQLAQYVKWVLFELFVPQLVHLWIVTLTYSLANMQSRLCLLNWRVVWVYSQTYIRSRSMSFQVLNDDDLLVKLLNKLSKIIHILRSAMFSSRFSVYSSLHLAHRRGTSAIRDIGECPDRGCKLYWATVLIWKYLKTSLKFFGHPILASVRFWICIPLGTALKSQPFTFLSRCQ